MEHLQPTYKENAPLVILKVQNSGNVRSFSFSKCSKLFLFQKKYLMQTAEKNFVNKSVLSIWQYKVQHTLYLPK